MIALINHAVVSLPGTTAAVLNCLCGTSKHFLLVALLWNLKTKNADDPMPNAKPNYGPPDAALLPRLLLSRIARFFLPASRLASPALTNIGYPSGRKTWPQSVHNRPQPREALDTKLRRLGGRVGSARQRFAGMYCYCCTSFTAGLSPRALT